MYYHATVPSGYGQYHQSNVSYLRHIVLVIIITTALGTGFIVTRIFAGIRPVNSELSAPSVVTKPSLSTPSPPPEKQQAPIVAPTSSSNYSSVLKNDLTAWQTGQKGSNWAFYIKSIDGGNLDVAVNESRQFEMASIYKLFLIKPLALKISPETWLTTKITSRTYADCVDAMLSVSDNPCAQAIVQKLGTRYINQQTKSYGYNDTNFSRSDYFSGTVANTGLLLTRLYQGDGYDLKTKELSLGALAKPKKIEALRGACSDCHVMNKIGVNNGVKHDAGIVIKNEKAYVVVIFSDHADWSKLTEVSKIINDYL